MMKPNFHNFIAEQNVQQQINQEIIPSQSDDIQVQPQQQPQQQLMANPFDNNLYKNVGVPDVPISYGNSMVESLLNDNEVPDDVKQKYWFVFHKDNVLTFLDEGRQQRKLLNFDILKIDILNAIPYYDYTFEKELEFDVLRNVFETKLDRALGYKGDNLKNERIMLQSQFHEQRQISEDGNHSQIREGFFKRLLGRR